MCLCLFTNDIRGLNTSFHIIQTLKSYLRLLLTTQFQHHQILKFTQAFLKGLLALNFPFGIFINQRCHYHILI